MQNSAQIVNFQRADSLVVPDAVNRCTADVVVVRQRVGAFTGFF